MYIISEAFRHREPDRPSRSAPSQHRIPAFSHLRAWGRVDSPLRSCIYTRAPIHINWICLQGASPSLYSSLPPLNAPSAIQETAQAAAKAIPRPDYLTFIITHGQQINRYFHFTRKVSSSSLSSPLGAFFFYFFIFAIHIALERQTPAPTTLQTGLDLGKRTERSRN